ncbi:MAG: site-specific integrase, partial [Geopsychrobacter sp.]|nr:site-specific integrase [Geopsychrobacter sp.]
MNRWLSEFLRHLEVERNLSLRTLEAYRRDLRQFLDFLVQQSSDPETGSSLEQIDILLLRGYLARLHQTHKRTSIARKLSALRTFFRYLVRQGVMEMSPADTLATPRHESYLPKVLSV